jgi:hypothetical protein
MNTTSTTSSFSDRERMRRKPSSQRDSHSISSRRLYIARLLFHTPYPALLGWHYWDEAKVEHQLSRPIVFVRPVHQQIYRP